MSVVHQHRLLRRLLTALTSHLRSKHHGMTRIYFFRWEALLGVQLMWCCCNAAWCAVDDLRSKHHGMTRIYFFRWGNIMAV
jgi:hypothetical protein